MGAVAIGGGCSRHSAADYMRRGAEFEAKSDHANAMIEYRNALQINPKLGEARIQLADVYAKIGDGQNALREYVRAADSMPENVDAQLKAGMLLLLANQFADAKSRAEQVLRLSPRNAGGLTLLGNALAGLNDVGGALDRLNQAVLTDPDQGPLYSNVGVMQLARGDRQMAEASFKKAVRAAPSKVEPRISLAHFYRTQGRDAEAEAMLKEAAGVDPESVQVNSNLAELYMSTGRVLLAEEPLKRVAAARPDPEPQFALADYYTRTRRPAQAAAILDKLAGNSQTYGLAKARLAAIDFTQGRADEAHRILDELLKREPNNRLGLMLKARLLLLEKKYAEAATMTKRAIDSDPEHAGEPHYLLGHIFQAQGRVEEAEGEFKQVLKMAPSAIGAQIALSHLYSAKGDKNAAVEFAQQAVTLAPGEVEPRIALIRALVASGNKARADRELQAMLQRFPASAAVQVQAGSLALARGDINAARAAFTRALELDRGSDEALAGMVALDLGGNNGRAAIERVDARLSAAPQNARAWLLAARSHALVGHTAEAEKALFKTIEIDPNSMQAYAMLGDLRASQGRMDDALAQFKTWASREPRSVAAHTMVGLTLERMNRLDEAKKTYERVLEIDPRAAVAANNLAWLHCEHGGNLDLAVDLAQMAKSRAPDQPAFNDTLAWIYYKKDLPEQAVTLLQQSLEKDPANALTHYHLGMTWAKLGEDTKAIASLKTALSLDPKLSTGDEARRTLAELQVQ